MHGFVCEKVNIFPLHHTNHNFGQVSANQIFNIYDAEVVRGAVKRTIDRAVCVAKGIKDLPLCVHYA